MTTFLYLLPIIAFVVWYIWIARNSRGKLGKAVRANMYANDWAPFLAGYRRAIRDIERTGLMPYEEPSLSYRAGVAFAEMYQVDGP